MHASETRVATLVVSVDIVQEQEASSLLTNLLDLLRRHRAPATWTFEFRRPAAVIDRIRGTWTSHEFGVLATHEWSGKVAQRTAFARELASRLACAEEMGVVPSALALRAADPPEHLDLLVRNRIPLVRTRTDAPSGTAGSLHPRLARYGVWQSEPTIVVPVASRWSLPWTARRLLQQAATHRQTLHVAVDAEQLAWNPASGLASLEYLLKLVSARRECGQLNMVPLSQLISIYAPRRERIASRSILRAA